MTKEQRVAVRFRWLNRAMRDQVVPALKLGKCDDVAAAIAAMLPIETADAVTRFREPVLRMLIHLRPQPKEAGIAMRLVRDLTVDWAKADALVVTAIAASCSMSLTAIRPGDHGELLQAREERLQLEDVGELSAPAA
jgi:hypothetical protein